MVNELCEVTLAGQDSEAEWDGFVGGHPDATGYHLWRWRKIFEDTFGHESHYLIARRANHIVGVLPLVLFRTALFGRFAVSLPFVNYGGVVAEDGSAARMLVTYAAAAARRLQLAHVEFRHRRQQFPDLPARQHKVTMLLDLPSNPEALWSRLDRKVRNQVRKAEKSGLEVAAGGLELLGEFYEVFAHNMRDLGTPVYSRLFFQRVLQEFPEATRVVVVKQAASVVAAGISYAHRDSLEVPWASSLRAYRSLCPNNLLYWTILQQAVRNGVRTFDFGRSTPGEGTCQFKAQWGARPEPLCWEYQLVSRQTLPDLSPKNPKFMIAIAMWKCLPVRIASLIGPRVVRAIP
jgi:FemAB-related protein (PEP-CTERM system-associated)